MHDASSANPDPGPAPATRDGDVRSSLARLVPWGIALCCAIAAAVLGVRSIALRSENDALRTERELATVASQLAQTQLGERTILAEKMISDLANRLRRAEDLGRLRVASLASRLKTLPDTTAVVVWDDEHQTGLLTVAHLPAVAAEQDYQLWITDSHDPQPVGAGTFKPSATGQTAVVLKAGKPLKQPTAFAITLEKKGGAPTAEGPLVLFGRP
jgi:hypothetical protein